jgi:rhamnogalacturonyl hydrolase YesR
MQIPRNTLVSLVAAGWLLLVAGCQNANTPAALSARVTRQYFSNWPAATSPQEVGKRVAENFVARPFAYGATKNSPRKAIMYPDMCSWYGSLTVAQLTGDKDLQSRLVKKFEPFLTPEYAGNISDEAFVDYRVFGIAPLEIYIQTRDERYLKLGQGLADRQWATPTADGITSEARYWIDDMYMITALQVQAFRATSDKKYLDRAALTMVAYLDKLQQPNGLFYHAPDSPFFWGRGNGWLAAGMTELLHSLPADHPQRTRLVEGGRKMMASLLKFQGEDGLWRQLIDQPDFWPETSGTGMFAFAMISGVKDGWLDAKTYGPAARKAWLGLITYLNPDANLRDVCAGTNKSAQTVGPDLAVQLQYYKDRPRRVGDLHGQAPILWSASALLR